MGLTPPYKGTGWEQSWALKQIEFFAQAPAVIAAAAKADGIT